MDLLIGKELGKDGERKEKFEKWLEERGILREMQLFFRQKMALMLQDPAAVASEVLERRKNWSTATRAVNWLIGEHLLQKGCCFSLSVFKSEAPLLEELPSLDSASDRKSQLVVSQIALENVLAEVGFKRGEQPFLGLYSDYRSNRGSLLECVLVHSRKVLEGWKVRGGMSGDYNSDTLRKLSEVDAYINRVRVNSEFVRCSSPPLHDVLKKRLKVDLEKFREQERSVIREEERGKLLEELYWKRQQTDLDLEQRKNKLEAEEKKFQSKLAAWRKSKADHEEAITEAVKELETSEKILVRKLAEVKELKARLSSKDKRLNEKQTEVESLMSQMQEEYQRFLGDDRDRAQLLEEVESLKTLMNSLYDAVAGLEEENRRLKLQIQNGENYGATKSTEKTSKNIDEEFLVNEAAKKSGTDFRSVLETVLDARDGELKRDMQAVHDALTKLAAASQSQKSEIRNATALVVNLESKLTDAQHQLDSLKAEYHEATARRRLLEKKMDLTRAVESRLLRLGNSDSDDLGLSSALVKKIAFLTSSSSNEDSRSSTTEDFLKESQRRMREIEDEVKDLDADLVRYRRRLAPSRTDLGIGDPSAQFLPETLGFLSRPKFTKVRFREFDDLSQEDDSRSETNSRSPRPSKPVPKERKAVETPRETSRKSCGEEVHHDVESQQREEEVVQPREKPQEQTESTPKEQAEVPEPPKEDASGPRFSLFAMNLDQEWNK